MKAKIPIGKRESQRLEFKAAAALESLSTVSREAVAMLNAEGGEIWIGLREHDGVATSVEAIRDAEDRKIALLNHLLDVIEPRLTSQEVDIRVVGVPEGGEILLVDLDPRVESRPYALSDL